MYLLFSERWTQACFLELSELELSENSTKQSVKVNLTKQIFWFVPLTLFNCLSFHLFLVLLRRRTWGKTFAPPSQTPRWQKREYCMLWRSEGKSSCRNLRSVSVDVLKTFERLLSLTAFRRPAALPPGGRGRQDASLNLHRIQKQSVPIPVKS